MTGHYYDTGAGPVELDPAPAPDPARAAYAAYVAHTPGCEECGRRLHGCDEAQRLWALYAAVRGPLCARCRRPIPPGRAVASTVDQGTGASPDVVLHADPGECGPTAWIRTYT